MKRAWFIATVAVSLTWCAAAAGVWALSWWHTVMIPSTAPGEPVRWITVGPLDKKYEITLARGSVAIVWQELLDAGEPRKIFNSAYFNPDPGPFSFKRGPKGTSPLGMPWGRHGVLVFPIWLLALLGAVLPAWRSVAYLRDRRLARRSAAGLCVICGYDLRGSPDRCPECGAAPDARATAAT